MDRRCLLLLRRLISVMVLCTGLTCYTWHLLTNRPIGNIQPLIRPNTDNLAINGQIRASRALYQEAKNTVPTSKTDFSDEDYEILAKNSASDQINSTSASSVLWTAKPRVYDSKVETVDGPPKRKLPQVLIIGVKKCGTRALLEFLRLHPDVRASGPETHFFDRHYDRGLEWYRQQMPPSLPNQLTMEKTPSYFITKEVPQRIRAMSPTVKLLVVVRDPVTRAISDYTQTASKRALDKSVKSPSFESLAFVNVSTGLLDTAWSALRIGVYARYLDWWLNYFHSSQIFFVSGEELVRDPAGEMGKIQDFLGIKRLITEKHFYFNETKGFPCLKKSEGNGSPHCLGKTKGRTHPDVKSSTIQTLRDFYRPFNLKFYSMAGRDFGW